MQPHISYGMLAWGKANQSTLQKTLTLHKKAIRTICKAKYNSHTEPLFKKLNILRILDQYIHQSLIFMFDYINNTLPVSFNGLFRYVHEARENYATRQSNHFIIERGVSNI